MPSIRRGVITAAQGQLTRTQAGGPAVSLEEAKAQLRITDDLENDIIERAVLAVQGLLEPPDGWLGRALTQSQYRLELPCLADEIVLPAPPLVQVDTVQYRASDGSLNTVSDDLYRVTDGDQARIVRAEGKSWPTIGSDAPDAVVIEFTAGYGPEHTAVPAAIKQWILYQVASITDIRQPIIVGASVTETPFVRDMLESWRVRL